MTDLIQFRRGTSAEWVAANPVLALAEPGLDTTTGVFKLGDGVTAWAGLAATGGHSSVGVILADAAQTFTTAVSADITWGIEISDPDGWTSGGSATLTVPAGKTGRYIISLTGLWSGGLGASQGIDCVINGAGVCGSSADTAYSTHNLTFIWSLVAGDTIKFSATQTSGGNRDLVSRLEIAPI